ncbi:MAG: hypothetical protein RIR70_623 [Pseudomonadota bacterium]
MNPRRRDLLLAAGLTLVFGASASARILVEGNMDALRKPSTPRRLSLRHAHTGETFTGLYRDHVGPLPDAMIDLSWFLRDHREDVRGPLHVETLDFLADLMGESGLARATVLSAYRTPGTNAKLATKYFGVAEKSQHLAGRAIDITLDTRLEKTAGLARTMSRGGVGWYPQSHFIHLDSGPVRQWTVDTAVRARSGDRTKPDDSLVAGFLEKKPRRPLSVSERLKLHKALARKQARPG